MNRMIGIALLLVSPIAIADWTLVGNGTAFVVHKNYALTAAHVIENCDAVTIRYQDSERDAKVSAVDSANDLGLLLLETPLRQTAKFRGGKPIELGDTVVTYGYRLFGESSDSAIDSTGKIHSLSGWGNDPRHIQYDAATEPGNDGGPVLDLSGNIVGVASTRFGKEYGDRTGNATQNVNFAIKSFVAEGFLSSNGVNFERAESKRVPLTAYLAKKEAQGFTVSVGCWEGSDATLVESSETVIYQSGSVYVGQLVDQKPNGRGTYSWSSGSKYTGDWIDGHKHGLGVYTWSNGATYVGDWKNDKADGHGTRTGPDGTTYDGEWKGGQRHGQGTWTHPNGEVYVGEYKDGRIDGQGIFTWASGNKYEGKFRNAKRHGEGTFSWANGQKFIGESKDEKFWNGVQFDQNGEPLGSFSNGVWKRISA